MSNEITEVNPLDSRRSIFPVGPRLAWALGEAAMSGAAFATSYLPNREPTFSLKDPSSLEFRVMAATFLLDAARNVFVGLRDYTIDIHNAIGGREDTIQGDISKTDVSGTD